MALLTSVEADRSSGVAKGLPMNVLAQSPDVIGYGQMGKCLLLSILSWVVAVK